MQKYKVSVMASGDTVLEAFSGWSRKRTANLLAAWAVGAMSASAAAFCGLLWLDYFFMLSRAVRCSAVAVGALLALRAAPGLVAKIRAAASWHEILKDVSEAEPEAGLYLAPAAGLRRFGVPDNVSRELAAAHLTQADQLAQRLIRLNLFAFKIEKKLALRAAAALIAAALAWRALPGNKEYAMRAILPWQEYYAESILSISPGDAELPEGSSVAIAAAWKSRKPGTPRLLVRQLASRRWRPESWTSAAGGKFVYRIDSLMDTVEYRLVYGGVKSRVYTLAPMPYPALKNIKARIQPPAYTGAPAFELDNPDGETEILYGSRVRLCATPNQRLRTASSALSDCAYGLDGRRSCGPARAVGLGKNNGSYCLEFRAYADSSVVFRLVSERGLSQAAPIRVDFKLRQDNKPDITLLSPGLELEAPPGGVVPVVYSASDDWGLARINVIMENEAGGKSGSLGAARFAPPGIKEYQGEAGYILDGLADGGKAALYLEAEDYAGNKAYSRKASVKAVDYDGRHAGFMDSAAEVASRLAALAAEHKALAAGIRESSSSVRGIDAAGLREKWDSLAAAAKTLAALADSDGYLSRAAAGEYRSITENINALAQDELEQALRDIAAGESGPAARSNAELGQKLGELAERARGAAAFQSLADADNFAANMQARAEALAKLMAGHENYSGEDWRELEKMLGGIQSQLDELGRLAANGRAASSGEGAKTVYLPVQEAQSLAAELMDAIRRRDVKKAQELAGRLSGQLSKMRRILNDSAESSPQYQSLNEASKKLERLQAQWRRLADRQAETLAATRQVFDSQLKRHVARQEELLARAEEIQGAAIAKAERLRPYLPERIVQRMRSLKNDIHSRQLGSASEQRRIIAGEMSVLQVSTGAAGIAELSGAEEGLARLIDEIQETHPAADARETQALQKNSVFQEDIRGEAVSLAGEIKSVKQGAAPPAVSQAEKNLGAAVEEMRLALGPLRAGGGERALPHQSQALEELRKGAKEIEKALEAANMAREDLSSGRLQRNMAAGNNGPADGAVKLPAPGEYMPPGRLRNEAMKSMRESFPSSDSGVIKGYLKRLSQ